MAGLRIGKLAEETNCQVESIRYYEQEKLLPEPARSRGNYRVYAKEHVERLSFIRNCRLLDMSLEEIRALLGFYDRPDQNCSGANLVLDEHIGHVAERVASLQKLEKQLKKLRRLCEQTQAAKDCEILHRLTRAPKASTVKGLRGHLRGCHPKNLEIKTK